MPQRHALVIGISQYRHGPPLPNVIRDGNEIAQVLKEPDLSNNQWIVTYYPEHYDERTGYEISTSKEVFCQDLDQKIDEFLIQADGDALIYFGCHGLLIKSNSELSPAQGYIAASDSDISEGNPLNCISFRDLFHKFCIAIERYRLSNLVILMDCCHAGVMADGYFERECLEGDFVTPSNGGKIGILAACRSRERAYEKDGYGVFSKAVLDALITPHPKTKKVSFNMLVESVVEDLKNSGQTAVSKASPGFDFELLHPRTESRRSGRETEFFIKTLQKFNYRRVDAVFNDFLEAPRKLGAFWIRGEPESGQHWLLSRLWYYKLSRYITSPRKIIFTIPGLSPSIEDIWDKIGSYLPGKNTPTEIRSQLIQNWKTRRTVILVLNEIENLPDEDIKVFLDEFWFKLFDEISEIINGTKDRLIRNELMETPFLLFMVDYGSKDNSSKYSQVDGFYSSFLQQNYNQVKPKNIVELVAENFLEEDLNWIINYQDNFVPYRRNTPPEELRQNLITYYQRENPTPQKILKELCSCCELEWIRDILPTLMK